MLKCTVVGRNPAPPVVYVKHGVFSISAGAGLVINSSSTADWPLWEDSLHPYLVAFPTSPMWTKKSPENPSISRVLPSKDVQYHLMTQTSHPWITQNFSQNLGFVKKLTLAVCGSLYIYIYIYIYTHIPRWAKCMDYLPTISEEWSHSRGNVGKHSHPMEHLGFMINKLKGADLAEYKSPTNTNWNMKSSSGVRRVFYAIRIWWVFFAVITW